MTAASLLRDEREAMIAAGVIRPKGVPSWMGWIDRPTLRLDHTGRRAAARHIAFGPDMHAHRRFPDDNERKAHGGRNK